MLLLVAAGSATAGIVAGRDTGASKSADVLVATSPVVTAPPQPPAVATHPRTTTTPPATTPKPTPSTGLIDWPARNGNTVVLSSIPARGAGLAEAKSKAEDAHSRGVQSVGVLDSKLFASLHPGYYVVFAGVYDSLEEALTAVARVAPKFPNAYARQIAR